MRKHREFDDLHCFSRSLVSGGEIASPRKPGSGADGVSSMATSSFSRSSAAMICARAVRDIGFKACCMAAGRYDGSNRDDYF